MKVKGNDLAGGGAGALIAWAWNGYFPDFQMPAEVAAVAGGLMGPVVRYFVGWLPESPGSLPGNGIDG